MLFYANFVGFDKMFSSTQRKLVSLHNKNIISKWNPSTPPICARTCSGSFSTRTANTTAGAAGGPGDDRRGALTAAAYLP